MTYGRASINPVQSLAISNIIVRERRGKRGGVERFVPLLRARRSEIGDGGGMERKCR